MARHHDGNRVSRERLSHGTPRCRLAHALSDPGVAPGLAPRNGARCFPHGTPERRVVGHVQQVVKHDPLSLEVPPQSPWQVREGGRIFFHPAVIRGKELAQGGTAGPAHSDASQPHGRRHERHPPEACVEGRVRELHCGAQNPRRSSPQPPDSQPLASSPREGAGCAVDTRLLLGDLGRLLAPEMRGGLPRVHLDVDEQVDQLRVGEQEEE